MYTAVDFLKSVGFPSMDYWKKGLARLCTALLLYNTPALLEFCRDEEIRFCIFSDVECEDLGLQTRYKEERKRKEDETREKIYILFGSFCLLSSSCLDPFPACRFQMAKLREWAGK